MPIYEYICANCGARAEAIQKLSDAPLTTCAACGQDALSRVVSAPSFTFKGSGWYITDYSAKGRQENASASSKNATGAAASASDNTASNAKPSTQAA